MQSKNMKKFVSFMLAIVMCMISTALPVFAAEEKSRNSEIQPIEELGISREEVIEALDLTEEEAEKAQFYAVNGARQRTFNSGDTYKFPTFTFTDYNVGSYFTVNANKIMYGVIWEIGADQPAAKLSVKLYPYREPCAYTAGINTTNEDGAKRLTTKSSWIAAYKGVDYHFVYEARAWEGDTRSVTSSVTMVIAVL